MGKKNKHDTILNLLVDRLVKTGKYDFIFKNYEYKIGKLVGEVDVLAFDMEKNRVRFYEVKSNDSRKAYDKAFLQFYRFKKAYNNLNVKGVYVTPTKIRRLR